AVEHALGIVFARILPAENVNLHGRDLFATLPLHQPGHSSSSSFSSSTTQPVWTFSRTRRTTRTRTNQFMVPMRVRKQMEALHEPCRSRREETLISVRVKVSLLTSAPTKACREGS